MDKIQNTKPYDLSDRTCRFAQTVVPYVNALPKTIPNTEIATQLIRSAGSIGANYIEAEDSLSKKDFVMRIKISRKEAKETAYRLKLSEPHEDSPER
ncbi:MAG: four helix bundle protein [Candidatus Aureabacteria bacterium]|nr:four helix bundle protein [Candidatus Auribacterota bacterium]